MPVARILIWNLYDSTATLAELRKHLPALPDGDVWIANELQERFGVISFAEEPVDLHTLVELIGAEPDVAEEFDVE